MQIVGLDIAGQNNTWICIIEIKNGVPTIIKKPYQEELTNILSYCTNLQNSVSTIVIDAPLSYAIDEENGYRDCEMTLRKYLKLMGFDQNYIMSANRLSAPLSRGRMLAEELKNNNFEGKIIEIVPRFCLAQFSLATKNVGKTKKYIKFYKKEPKKYTKPLWTLWTKYFFKGNCNIQPDFSLNNSDGIIDSLVCATIGILSNSQNPIMPVILQEHKNKNRIGYVQGIYRFKFKPNITFQKYSTILKPTKNLKLNRAKSLLHHKLISLGQKNIS